jgi:hypothetical protein
MTQELHTKLAERLEKDIDTYRKVTSFANLLPLFEKEIIEKLYTGEQFAKLSNYYKGLSLSWGINWRVLKPTNYPESKVYESGTVEVYVNVMSLFNTYNIYDTVKCSLYEHMKNVPCYFFDNMNSTYYFKPNEIEVGLDALNDWYNKVKTEVEELRTMYRVKLLEEELAKLKGNT